MNECIPESELPAFMAALNTFNNSTTYKHELVLSAPTRRRLAQKMRQIAAEQQGTNPNNSDIRIEKKVTWNEESFAEGEFRYAIMGTWKLPVVKRGEKCVIKHFRKKTVFQPTGWATTMRMYEEASELAKEFNKFHKTHRVVTFVEVDKFQCTEHHIKNIRGPKLNEYFVVEPYLSGNFTKWCNNNGYWNITDQYVPLMQAFMHWSWWYTNSETMISDLQGTADDTGYTLTDPALLSIHGDKYGATDVGVEGMTRLFLNHTCNSICQHLKKPTPNELKSCIPASELQNFRQVFNAANTSYQYECKLTELTRRNLEYKLKDIANRS